MSNSSSATKLAIARLRGDDLPQFVPRLNCEDVAKQVRECISQSDSSKNIKVSKGVRKELEEHLAQYKVPQYTISQYLLILLCSASTTASLIEQHNSGLITDRKFIEGIKGGNKQNSPKIPRKVGGQKSGVNGGDRASNASKVHQRTSAEFP